MKHKRSLCAAAAAACLTSTTSLWAQTATPTVVITGNPLGARDAATPASVLAGESLVLRRASSLGETLDGLPGVASSYFGPNANRPVIRGQDGDRIRLLGNGGATLDASALSFDHAVPIDPLVVERIEVLRGPAALLYGGSAVGGVVNAIDNRIPKVALSGLSGVLETRLGGAASERAASGLLELGTGPLALHADAFARRTGDLRVPAFERPLPEGGSERRNFVANSASRAEGGAVGASVVGSNGFAGASLDTYRNDYGIVVEDGITVHLRRNKLALAGEWRQSAGPLAVLRAQAASTDYQHQEVEADGAIGTTFKTRGTDARLEAVHRAWRWGGGQLEGTLGAQFESSRFSALGEEAFVPSTHTRQAAAFVLERFSWPGASGAAAGAGAAGSGHVSAGLRAEQVLVRSDGDAEPERDQFGPAQERRFSPRSASVAALYRLTPQWQISASWSRTERAPTSYELYANGVHAATAAFERGDTQQGMESSRSTDLALAWQSGAHQFKLTAFASRFARYIALDATGEPDFVDDEGATYPVFAFSGARARLSGLEAEAQWRLLDGAHQLDLEARYDTLRGTNLDRQSPLPRLTPQRLTLGLRWSRGPWMAQLEVQRASAQNRVMANDEATPGWTLVNLGARYELALGGRNLLLFAKLGNAGNTLARSASSISTVRALSPLPGRSLAAGLRWTL